MDNPVWPIQMGRSAAVPGASPGGAGESSASPSSWAQPPPQFAAIPPARRGRSRWWLFGCGGCGALVLSIVVVTAALFATSFSSSPLRHFPAEAGASSVSDNFVVSGGGSAETLVIDDPRSLTDVETFYESALSTNGWTVQASDPAQAQSGDSWPFSQVGSSAQFAVSFVATGATTEITVQYETGASAVATPLPTAQSADSSITALMLNVTEASRAAGGAVPLSGFIDVQMGGQADADMRTYVGNDGTASLIIALVVDSSRAAAATDYPSFVSASCPMGGQSKPTHPTIGTADKADEFDCVKGVGTQLVFLQGHILCGVSAASASVAEAVARAESAKLAQIAGA